MTTAYKTDTYIIVSECWQSDLEDLVNEYIKKGYVPVGGVAFKYNDRGKYCKYLQAMIKQPTIDNTVINNYTEKHLIRS